MIFAKKIRSIRPFILCLSFTALGCAPDGDAVSSSSKELIQQTPLYFQVEQNLSLNAVAKRIRSSLSEAQGVPPRVFVEFVQNYKTTGIFFLKSKYASLSELAADLSGQEAKYTWEAADDTLFVYPAQEGFLTRKVGATSFAARSFCGVIERLSLLANPGLKEADVLSCMYKGGAPQFTKDIPGAVFTDTVLGEPEVRRQLWKT